jgi:F-type H+-transporting ATPase subunit epsilon
MHLKVLLPTEVLVDEAVVQVTAEAENGSFSLLPRHIDFVAALTPGLLSYVTAGDEQERFLAINEGILVKCGAEVLVSTQSAVAGPDLGRLQATIEEQFRFHDERERLTRSAMARLEADFVRRFLDI